MICEDFKWQAPVLHGARRGTIRADGLKLALVKMWESSDEVDAFPVLAIHDEIVVESPAEKADEVKEWLTACMVDGMTAFLRDVPVEVEIAVEDSWG